jgi:hypothetical protein
MLNFNLDDCTQVLQVELLRTLLLSHTNGMILKFGSAAKIHKCAITPLPHAVAWNHRLLPQTVLKSKVPQTLNAHHSIGYDIIKLSIAEGTLL